MGGLGLITLQQNCLLGCDSTCPDLDTYISASCLDLCLTSWVRKRHFWGPSHLFFGEMSEKGKENQTQTTQGAWGNYSSITGRDAQSQVTPILVVQSSTDTIDPREKTWNTPHTHLATSHQYRYIMLFKNKMLNITFHDDMLCRLFPLHCQRQSYWRLRLGKPFL